MKDCPTADICAELLKKMKETHKELRVSIEAIDWDDVELTEGVDLSAEIEELTRLSKKRVEIKL